MATRQQIIEELELACTKALLRVEGTTRFLSVSITAPDEDTRMVCFEGAVF